MKGKAALVLGLAAGYVLGTRDGRERYEQIKAQANRLWNDPAVQKKASQAQEAVKEKAPQVPAKVSDAAHRAADAAAHTVADKTGSPTHSRTTRQTASGLDG